MSILYVVTALDQVEGWIMALGLGSLLHGHVRVGTTSIWRDAMLMLWIISQSFATKSDVSEQRSLKFKS